MSTTEKQTETCIWVTTTFVGYHLWADAPDEVSFLRNNHRHLFYVCLEVAVKHLDREVEFFILKKQLNDFIDRHWSEGHFASSCEMIAQSILEHFTAQHYHVRRVSVSEDNENGATIYVK